MEINKIVASIDAIGASGQGGVLCQFIQGTGAPANSAQDCW